MQKLTALLVVSAALAGAASAQMGTKVEDPIRFELGAYIPTYKGGHNSIGVGMGLGYSFLEYKGIDVAATVHGQFFHANLDSGHVGADLTALEYGIDLRYRPLKNKLFVGAGLNAYRAAVDPDDFGGETTTKLGYSVEAGYDVTKSLYGMVRFQAMTDDYKQFHGVTVGVGYRF